MNNNGFGLPNVVVLDSAFVSDCKECDIERDVLKGIASVELLHTRSEADLAEVASEIRGCIAWHHVEVTELSLSRMARGTVIVRNGVGFDNIDVSAAARNGVVVCNVPDYGTEEVADHTIGLLLALARGLRRALQDVAEGNWRWQVVQPVRRLRGLTLGIVGCGRIGTAVALRAKAFGMRVLVYDPYLHSGFEKALGVGRCQQLSDLLPAADIVTLHVPLSEETFHLISHQQLREMKQGSLLINTSRGPVVDERALIEVLPSGRLSGAAVDVVETEPHVPSELVTNLNCLVTPHCAFYSEDSYDEMRRKAAMTLKDALQGRPVHNIVNGAVPSEHLSGSLKNQVRLASKALQGVKTD